MSKPAPGRLRRSFQEMPGGPAAFIARGPSGGDDQNGAGQAVPALLLHGFAGDLLTWQFALAALAGSRRVIAVDLPGHGQSTLDVGTGVIDDLAAWVLAFMDSQTMGRAHLVGHSMGGAISLAVAAMAPERVASLSLVATAGLGPDFDLDYLLDLVGLPDGDPDAATMLALRLFAPESVIGLRMAPRVGGLIADLLRDPERRAALGRIVEHSFVPARQSPPPPPDWSAFGMPVQLLWGCMDSIIPVPGADLLSPATPLHLFDKAGHMPHNEMPGPVVRCLADFMAAADAGA